MEFIKALPEKTSKRKKLRVSKNRKRNWTKHIDITDIEDDIENKRIQEIHGPVQVELEGLLEKIEEEREEVSEEAPKKKFKLDLSNLKCYTSLRSKSKINTPYVPAKPKSQKPSKLREWMEEREKAKKLKRAISGISQKSKKGSDEEDLLWNEEDSPQKESLEPWVEHDLRQRRKLRPKPTPRHYAPTSLLPGIELPTHGQSAHPEPEEHKALLLKAHEEELFRTEEETKWRQKLYVPPEQRVDAKIKLQEALQGLPGCEEEDDYQEEEEEEAPLLVKPPIRSENRKTKKQRRKERLQKEKEAAAKAKKLEKKGLNKMHQVKAITKEMIAKQKESAARSLRRVKGRATYKMFKTHKLGPKRYEERPLATQVPLTEELPAGGSMRLLAPITGQGTQIYHGLLRRNLIEPRSKQRLAKRKIKNRLHEKN